MPDNSVASGVVCCCAENHRDDKYPCGFDLNILQRDWLSRRMQQLMIEGRYLPLPNIGIMVDMPCYKQAVWFASY